jgi:hypothetical protein
MVFACVVYSKDRARPFNAFGAAESALAEHTRASGRTAVQTT